MTENQKSKYFTASAILALAYLLLSYFVNKDVFRTIDYDTLVAFQNTFGRFVDLPFSVLTLLGSSEAVLTVIGAIFLYLFWRKKHIFSAIFLIFAIYVIELAGKILIYHPKPPVVFNRYALDIFLPSSFIVHTDFSYPSGHMARISYITLIILFILLSTTKQIFKKKLYGVICAIFVLLIFVSRIYLAEHWLSDVLGGLLLGGSLATLAIGFW